MTIRSQPTPVQRPGPPSRSDVESVPSGPRARVAAAGAEYLFRRVVRTLPLRVEMPDGALLGTDTADPAQPRLILHRPRDFYARLGLGGLIGFGESYMAGDWSAPDPAATLEVFAARVATLIPAPLQRLRRLYVARHPAAERNSEDRSRDNIARHYDLSNDFFALFLDETLTYSSALFADLDTPPAWTDLTDAQRAKIDRILDTAGVGPGTRLLEIGTGWGELALRAAARGATVRSVTLSVEQRALAEERIAHAGLADRVDIDLLDYRCVAGEYDAVVSVEMIEAVGYEYLDTFFGAIDRVLAPGGRAVIQAITMPHERMLATRETYTWVQKYIFPGGFLPSPELIGESVARSTRLAVRESFSMGPHYARTLRLWQQRFDFHRDEVAALGFDPVFRRMWRLYLAYSEAGFRSGYLDVRQILLTAADQSERPSR
ncbi:SAM-dependent methyltransferase [Nocardia arizonensis]|uniref:SAM-dependent methyltransferase n=1 Tax=Nocardia arizonensis TaxID=1141647 RepID=UPI0006D02AE4|nr:cyclopropane-fatty-acyl-phospholipid synthase family protein [Nocardia arizonensis]